MTHSVKHRAYQRISSWPPEERPREKMSRYGAQNLSDAELLAILLRTGRRDLTALDLARSVLTEVGGLAQLGRMSTAGLQRIKGIGEAKAVTIAAAFRLGSRFLESNAAKTAVRVSSADDVFKHFGPSLKLLNHEVFKILLLNTNNAVIRDIVISSGHLNASVVHAREIFKAAVDHLAASVILIHNHPSGNPKPSSQDISVTEKICESGKIIGIPVLDHVIIADNSYFSFADSAMI